MKKLLEVLIKLLAYLHSVLYSVIGRLATQLEGGLHPKHRIMNYHKFFVDNINEDDIVLDIGCGVGALASDLAKKAKKVLAIDVNRKNIEAAKRKYCAKNIEYILGDATNYDFNQKFDVVVLSNVLEHIQDRKSFILKIKNLSPKFLIRVPLLERDWLVFYKKEIGIDYRLDKTHYIEYKLDDLKEEINQCGLFIENFFIKFGEIYSIVRE